VEIGALHQEDGRCEFVVWAPLCHHVTLHLVAPIEKRLQMHRDEKGYWRITLREVPENTQYLFQLDNTRERPDPASRSQPNGVHRPSALLSLKRDPLSNWQGIPLNDYLIYELHIGTFTPTGTFAEAITKIPYLKTLGITAVEIMPVAQCPGKRNWGYDGVYPYAVQNNYGGAPALKKFVNACHTAGIAVILDVVYNHLGPEGNYLQDYAPYFSDQYTTPWGKAINYDGCYSDEVRNYFRENAKYWIRYFDIDALRLDAIDTIHDESATHFLKELTEHIAALSTELGREYYLIAESDLNDPKIIKPFHQCGYGLSAQWADDFHRALHVTLTGEKVGVYADFTGISDFVKSYRENFVNTGQYSPYRQRRHGTTIQGSPPNQFVVFSQNHDQVGNRCYGERLSHLVSLSTTRIAAGAVLLSPYIPLLFMGEEYGEQNPFLYFIDHSDEFTINAVREGRKNAYHEVKWAWHTELPDPQDQAIFLRSKLHWALLNEEVHATLFAYYQTLIKLRKTVKALRFVPREQTICEQLDDQVISVKRRDQDSQTLLMINFGKTPFKFMPTENWTKLLDSAEKRWLGHGTITPSDLEKNKEVAVTAESLVLFAREVTQV
jgi:maltooligosyltrehalose trehalohydrolase